MEPDPSPGVVMLDQHRRAVDRLHAEYERVPEFPALIIGGSVARGFARPDSDVDFIIVAREEEFARRLADRDLFINRTDLCDYPGGYVDGKIVSEAYLRDLAERGNEPSRAALEGAFALYSHIPDLEPVLRRIPVYPESGHEERLQTFYTLAFIQRWLMGEAVRHGNRYTILRAASQLALYAGRMILAHNRVLFPYHKWFMRALETAPEKPERFMPQLQALLDAPGVEPAEALFDSVCRFRDWGVSDLEAYTRFMTDVEWSWWHGNAPMEDW